MSTRLTTCIGLLLTISAALVEAQVNPQNCGSLQNAIGPWDYRTVRGDEMKLVETAHFTQKVEMALQGERGYLGQDIDYTLRAYPNHHRALITLQRYEAKLQRIGQQDRLPRPIECYYERAIRWKADDVLVRMIYAQFLYRHERSAEASAQLQVATTQAAENALTHYNIGLVYLEGKDYAQAREQARRALGLGFDRPALREQLGALGQWDQAASPTEAASAAAPR